VSKVSEDAHKQIDPAVATGVTGRADDHWHAEATRREQHRLEIVGLLWQRARRGVCAERHRPDIAGPGISADQIGLTLAANVEAAGLDRRETEMTVRAHNPQCMVCRTSVLDRSGHRELSLSVSPIDLVAMAITPSWSRDDDG
jgi:hypothetical protein